MIFCISFLSHLNFRIWTTTNKWKVAVKSTAFHWATAVTKYEWKKVSYICTFKLLTVHIAQMILREYVCVRVLVFSFSSLSHPCHRMLHWECNAYCKFSDFISMQLLFWEMLYVSLVHCVSLSSMVFFSSPLNFSFIFVYFS